MTDVDAIVIGAGHNGLAAAASLAKEGLQVLVLEKNSYVGGMAATREFFPGFRHNVGAWALMVLCEEIEKEYGIFEQGLETIDPPTSFTNFGIPGEKPFIMYNKIESLIAHVEKDHGSDAMEGLERVFDSLRLFESVWMKHRFEPPVSLGKMLDSVSDDDARESLRKWFFLSAREMIDACFTDQTRHGLLKNGLLGTAVDGTGRSPSSPGTAFSLAYHLVSPGLGRFYRLVKGGMGNLSEALKRSCEQHGGIVQLKSPVEKILVEKGRAVGVELKGGDRITAKAVLSSVDAGATFIGLIDEDVVPSGFLKRVKGIKYESRYIQVHVTLSELPRFTGDLSSVNEGGTSWLMAYYGSHDHLEQNWFDCIRGNIPENPMSTFYIPSMWDSEMAPPGYHTGTFFSFYFPEIPPGAKHNEMKERMADKLIDRMNQYAPNFKEAIADRLVFTPLHFQNMCGITGGDYAHGALVPEQMLNYRPVLGASDYRTPVENLYLCGSACHPGPGVTGIPGYNAAKAALKDWSGSSQTGGNEPGSQDMSVDNGKTDSQDVLDGLEMTRSRIHELKQSGQFSGWNRTMEYFFTDRNEYYHLTIEDGLPGTICKGKAGDAEIRYEMEAEIFCSIMKGTLDGAAAWKKGQVKLRASMGDKLKLFKLT